MGTLGRFVLCSAVLLVIAGCGGPSGEFSPRGVSLSALPGSQLTGVSYVDQTDSLRLSFSQVPADGTFVRLALMDGRRLTDTQLWSEQSYFGLAVPTATGADIGVFALADTPSIDLNLALSDESMPKLASVPPVGEYNVISDLTVTDVGFGEVNLNWTQINTGDYDFNGLVGITDITPIGQLLGTTYDRNAANASSQRAFWVDGNGDGVISVSDITPIGQNFGAYIAGYNIRMDGEAIDPVTDGEPTVPRSAGETRENLPPTYSVVMPGSAESDWAVVAVDDAGVEGSGSGDIVGDISLRANLDFSGLDLFDLDGTNPGPFDFPKIGSRLIEPGEIIGVARWEVNGLDVQSRLSDNTLEIVGAPRGELLYLDLYYLPVVDLTTGDPRQLSSVRGASMAPSLEYVVTTVPFTLPDSGTVESNIAVAFSPNPDGGYFTELTVDSVIPGDNPATPEVEESYAESTHSRLANATGVVSDDTDFDGSFEDEVELLDSDRDGISDARLAHDIALGNGKHEKCGELKIEGTLVSFNELAGEVVLSGAEITEGGEGEIPDPWQFYISELTRFEEHVLTDEGLVRRDIDPGSLAPGDTIEVTLICQEEGGDPLPDTYYIEKLMRKLDERTK